MILCAIKKAAQYRLSSSAVPSPAARLDVDRVEMRQVLESYFSIYRICASSIAAVSASNIVAASASTSSIARQKGASSIAAQKVASSIAAQKVASSIAATDSIVATNSIAAHKADTKKMLVE